MPSKKAPFTKQNTGTIDPKDLEMTEAEEAAGRKYADTPGINEAVTTRGKHHLDQTAPTESVTRVEKLGRTPRANSTPDLVTNNDRGKGQAAKAITKFCHFIFHPIDACRSKTPVPEELPRKTSMGQHTAAFNAKAQSEEVSFNER